MKNGSAFLLAVAACLVTSTACLVRTRTEQVQPAVLRTATLEELVEKLEVFGEVKTMLLTVDLRLSVALAGEVEQKQQDGKQEIRDFTEVRGFILIRRPSSIRTLAELPVVRSTAFDMVSDGQTFKVHIPPKNRFVVGDAAAKTKSEKRIDRVRPQHLLEAVLIDPPREDEPYQVLENLVFTTRGFQVVHLMRNGSGGKLELSRKVWFDRTSFNIVRLQIFDATADPVADVRYGNWSREDSLPFPGTIFFSRPKEGYEVQIRISKAGLNEPIPDDRFVLKPPEGIDVERVGEVLEDNGGETPGQ